MSTMLFIGSLVIPVVGYFFAGRFAHGKNFRFLLFWMLCGTCYGLLLLSVRHRDVELKARLAQFDLNHDGVFSGAENTPEMRQAMLDVTADTGRTFAPITGVLFSIFWVGIVCLSIPWFRKKLSKDRSAFSPRSLLSF